MAGNPTTEQIDERILGLLGLDGEYELSYEEYVRNLKEAMVASRMSKSKFSTEESELITNEWKRVKSKKGRFKPKKKKITAAGLGIGKGFTSPLKITQQKFLPPQISKNTARLVSSVKKSTDKDVKNDSDNVVLRISKTLDSILQTLIDTNKENKKKLEKERIDAEGRARSEKENRLESKPFEKIKKAFDVITKPFQSIWDIFANFIKNVILGRIVVKLLDWFGDPKNQGKVKSLTRFLVDFGPALLAGFVLFGTRFGGAVRFLSSIALKGIWRLSKFAIPKILKFIARNPIAAGIALVTAGAWVPAMFPGTVNEQERKTDKAPGTKEDKIKVLEKQKVNLNIFEKIQGKGGEIDDQLSYLKTGKTKSYGFSGGGLGKVNKGKMFGGSGSNPISTLPKSKKQKQKQKPNGFVSGKNGLVKGKKGVDKVPAMLSDGEIVFSVPAVNYWGADTLLGMNKEGGGTNKPKVVSGTTYAAGGGLIGSIREAYNKRDLKPVVDEIIRGLAPRYKWAQNLATRTGVGINRTVSDLSERGQRVAGEVAKRGQGVAGEGAKMINPTIQRAQRVAGEVAKRGQGVAGEGAKMINPTIQRAQRVAGEVAKRGQGVAGEVKKKVDPTIQAALKFRPDLSGIQGILGNASGAAQEALPALLGSTLGISRTDKSISEDMQKSLLQARNTAGKKGRNYVDYKDYVGGGLSAGGLTMGRIADKEWKRDSKGRIIGLRQVYDTNRSAKEALSEAGSSWEKFFKSGLRDTGALGRGVYKPAEALLAAVQDRGKTMHDVNFDEKVLGFKPGKEVLNDTQRGMIAGQKNREALQEKRPWWDKMGMFGGASAQMKKEQMNPKIKNKQALESKRPWWDKMGMFGGASAQMKKEQMNPQSVGKQGPTIARKTTPPPIKPPAGPKVTVIKAGQGGAKPNSPKSSSGTPKAPSFGANHGKTRTASSTLGINKK